MAHLPWSVYTVTATGNVTTVRVALKHLRLVCTVGALNAVVRSGGALGPIVAELYAAVAVNPTDDLPFADDHLAIAETSGAGLHATLTGGGTGTLYAYTK